METLNALFADSTHPRAVPVKAKAITPDTHMTRRRFLSQLAGSTLLRLHAAVARGISTALALIAAPAAVHAGSSRVSLLRVPLEVRGDWGGSQRRDVVTVLECMRTACLADVPLRSDRQPATLRVDNRPGNYPSVRLQTTVPDLGWINVAIGARDWCMLSYQFGHELGHVLCNSWQPDARPRNPCQWIEEALVEALSLKGLGTLADTWASTPPFPNDGSYANSIRDYRQSLVSGYRETAQEEGAGTGLGAWFRAHEAVLAKSGGLDAARGAVLAMLNLLEGDATVIQDLGALNRWRGRSGVPLHDYLARWEESCAELDAPGRLPGQVRDLLSRA